MNNLPLPGEDVDPLMKEGLAKRPPEGVLESLSGVLLFLVITSEGTLGLTKGKYQMETHQRASNKSF